MRTPDCPPAVRRRPRRWLAVLLVSLLAPAVAPAQVLGPAQTDSLLTVLQQRVDKYKQVPGLVVGLVNAQGTQVLAWGKSGNRSGAALDSATLFEIGSITKVFTTLALAEMVTRGELKLEDPAQSLLPAGVRMPVKDGQAITLQHLATHTSGLPRIPTNMLDMDETNPYAAYSADKLYAFLNSYEPTRPVGGESRYSNLGVGLLGQLLSLKAGESYEALIEERVCAPLGLASTRITLSAADSARLAVGHNAEGKAVPNWDFDALAGCGALRSSAADLLRFLAANLGLADSPLSPAMRLCHAPRASLGVEGLAIGLGWMLQRAPGGDTLVWHNGGTGGYRSFAGFSPVRALGVVVLANGFGDIDDIGLHLLDPALPLADLEKPHRIKLSESALRKFVGYYEIKPGAVFAVTWQDGQLAAQVTGQPRLNIYPESETGFFYQEVPTRLRFSLDQAGEPTGLVINQNGMQIPARRLGPDYTPPEPPKAVKLERALLDRYQGEYALTPQMTLKVFLKGDRLFIQATGQSAGEVIPVSETEFVNEEAGARFVFKLDEAGQVTGLVLQQAGMELPAAKVK